MLAGEVYFGYPLQN